MLKSEDLMMMCPTKITPLLCYTLYKNCNIWYLFPFPFRNSKGAGFLAQVRVKNFRTKVNIKIGK